MFLKLGDGVLRLNHMKLLIFDYLDLQKQFHVVQLTIRVGFFLNIKYYIIFKVVLENLTKGKEMLI